MHQHTQRPNHIPSQNPEKQFGVPAGRNRFGERQDYERKVCGGGKEEGKHFTSIEPGFTEVLALSTQVFSWAPKFLCSPCKCSTPGYDVALPKSGLVENTYNPNTEEVEEGGSEVQGHPQLP
ncbi:hypothetical protein STEG23_004597, partial [Scotinomys teguina]